MKTGAQLVQYSYIGSLAKLVLAMSQQAHNAWHRSIMPGIMDRCLHVQLVASAANSTRSDTSRANGSTSTVQEANGAAS